jgi:hypothetical protein
VVLDLDRERLVNSEQGRRGWLREGRRQLAELRRQQARPIAGPRPKRLRESKHRLEEDHQAQTESNAAYPGTINTTDHDSRIMRTTGQPAVQGDNAQAAVNETQIIVAAELSVESGDFGHLEPMIDATIKELQRVGVSESPQTVVVDPGYWHKQQLENIVANRHIQVLIPPDSGLRTSARPGWNKGLYAHMRRVLQTELGQQPSEANGDGRAGVRPKQVQPRLPPLPATRTNRRGVGVAVPGNYSQPAEAAQPPDRGGGSLTRPALTDSARSRDDQSTPSRPQANQSRSFVRHPPG